VPKVDPSLHTAPNFEPGYFTSHESCVWIQDGFQMCAQLHPADLQFDQRDLEDGPYSTEDFEAWQRGDWFFVTLQVTATRCGIELADEFISGVDCNLTSGEETAAYFNTLAAEMAPNAIYEANKKIKELCASVQEGQ
jgi:hypothetical protein